MSVRLSLLPMGFQAPFAAILPPPLCLFLWRGAWLLTPRWPGQRIAAEAGSQLFLGFVASGCFDDLLEQCVQGSPQALGSLSVSNAGRAENRGRIVHAKKVEIPHQKVQVLKVREPLLRRWMGYGTVYIETAGLGSVKEGCSPPRPLCRWWPSQDEDALTAALPDFIKTPGRMNLPNLPAMPCFGLGSPAPCRIFRLWFFALCFTGRLVSHSFFFCPRFGLWLLGNGTVRDGEWTKSTWWCSEESCFETPGLCLEPRSKRSICIKVL